VDAAADRLAALILELAGGTLADGALRAGPPVPGPKRVSMRPDRCRAILGVDVPDRDMVAALERLGFAPRVEPGAIACTVPVFRMDVEREIDLIEEVGRIHGLDRIPVRERIELRVSPPQASEMARQTIANELAAMGFVETVTHSLIGEEAAGLFLAPGAGLVRVDDERARSEPVLRPSIVPSLLRVRRHNQDNGVRGLRLFESAATFWHEGEGHREVVTLGLLMDVEDDAHGLRPLRGVVDRVVAALLGHDAKVDVRSDEGAAWLAPGGQVLVGGRAIGRYGLLAPSVAARFGLDDPLLAGEIELAPLIARFPPETQARPLPAFPAIERDLSILVAESARWADVQAMTAALALDHLEATEFVTTFRGKQIPAGHKSLTFRMRFRAADRTLRHDEVDPLVARVVAAAAQRLAAQVRT
jgi:phenylalanyl-tRNA synthetase beta chain